MSRFSGLTRRLTPVPRLFVEGMVALSDRLRSHLDGRGRDLGLVDEVFAVFVGATLILSYSGWQSGHPRIVAAILSTVMAVVTLSIAAANEPRLLRRCLFYILGVASAFGGVWWIGNVAAHDISVTITPELRALPIGTVVWVVVREAAVLLMNLTHVQRSGSQQGNPTERFGSGQPKLPADSSRWGRKEMDKLRLKIGITVAAGLLIIARLLWPNIKIDAITIGLFIAAILPWLTSLIESAKLPGGWEVKFRDLKSASDALPAQAEPPADRNPTLLEVAQLDANLALVYLRVEIEKRLRTLAEIAGLDQKQPLTRLFRELQRSEEINHPFFSGLQEVVIAGNQAAHGATVEPSLADWAIEFGPKIIDALDQILEERGTPTTGSRRLR